jgi:putative transposase
LNRSPTWFDKWWGEYQRQPQTDFADRSRAPHTCPQQMPGSIGQAVIQVRRRLEAGRTAPTRYGLIGHRAIRDELERLGITPRPSLATIQRILGRHELTHRPQAEADTAYYPEVVAWMPNAIHATDIITKHLHGGQVVQNLHTFDHYTHAVHLSQHADKRSTTIRAHVLGSWADLGLPVLLQLDNESSFRGGHTHPRVIGQVLRLCLFVGVHVLFIPYYEAKRNYWVEGFHSLWVQAFWSRQTFHTLGQIQREAPKFSRWYHTRYRPPSLAGQTPAQRRDGCQVVRLTPPVVNLIPDRLPITQGRINFIRKVDPMGTINVLNQSWSVGRKWIGEYVWVGVDTAQQTLTIWHKPDEDAAWHQIKVPSALSS